MPTGYDHRHAAEAKQAKEKQSLAIVAEDLTGACDAAVAFTEVCSAVRTGIAGIPCERALVWAVSMGTRGLEPMAARYEVRCIMKMVEPETSIFKKMDSVFRGNTLEEIHEAVECAAYDLAILAPAHPNFGRTVVHGTVFVRDANREWSFPVAERLERMGCGTTRISAGLAVEHVIETMETALDGNKRLVLCDAASFDDLSTVVKAARSVATHPLWIGSGGLARALAEEFPLCVKEEKVERTGNVAFFLDRYSRCDDGAT